MRHGARGRLAHVFLSMGVFQNTPTHESCDEDDPKKQPVGKGGGVDGKKITGVPIWRRAWWRPSQ